MQNPPPDRSDVTKIRDANETDAAIPLGRASLSRRVQFALWVLRIVSVLLTVIVIYVFIAQLAT